MLFDHLLHYAIVVFCLPSFVHLFDYVFRCFSFMLFGFVDVFDDLLCYLALCLHRLAVLQTLSASLLLARRRV